MKVVLAGAFGHLGSDILRKLMEDGHDVVAFGRSIREIENCKQGYKAVKADVCDKDSLQGICDNADVVISTVGLVKPSAEISCYDVDLKGNLNLLEEAVIAGVKHFSYVSVLRSDEDKNVPLLNAKYEFEKELKKSGISWSIIRPGGYFYDTARVFMPMVEKGTVTLLGKENVSANVVDTPDLASFIVEHMCDDNKMYDVGGKETNTYEEIAKMFFEAAGKEPVIKRAPIWLFDMLAWINKCKGNGKDSVIRFSKFVLTHNMVGDHIAGDKSFAEYIKDCYAGNETP